MGNETERCSGLAGFLSSEFFKALADPNRIAILARMAEEGGEKTVSEVARCCPVDVSVVSRHLKILRAAGILEAEKRGKEVLYRIRIGHLVSLLRGLADALETCCPDGICTIAGGPSGEEQEE